MSQVKANITANLIGSGWVALISIAFIPLYIRFMGIESYGLVGFYITLQALFYVLDVGLTSTLSRELARLSVFEDKAQEMRNLVRTMEIIYWVIAALIVSSVIILAPLIESKWLNVSQLSSVTVRHAIMLMGFLVGVRMLYGFYNGGLLGLQRQVLSNLTKVGIETFRSAGVVFILWMISPTIVAFFIWQLGISVIGLIIVISILWRCLPNVSGSAVFQQSLLLRLWKFVAGISIISILATILVQMDKLILSKILSLEEFAYYVLASVVAMGLYIFISPIFTAIYPRFTQLVAAKNIESLKVLYHLSCQLITVLVIPVALVIFFFANEILSIWTKDIVVSQNAAPLLSILVVGTALNGMMNIPYALQLAYGWTRLGVSINLIALILLVPALLISVKYFGMIGAAMVWLVLNACYIIFGLRIMHKRLLKNEFKYWILYDFLIPSVGSFIVVFILWTLKPDSLNAWIISLYMLIVYLVSVVTAIALTRNFRSELHAHVCKHFRVPSKA